MLDSRWIRFTVLLAALFLTPVVSAQLSTPLIMLSGFDKAPTAPPAGGVVLDEFGQPIGVLGVNARLVITDVVIESDSHAEISYSLTEDGVALDIQPPSDPNLIQYTDEAYVDPKTGETQAIMDFGRIRIQPVYEVEITEELTPAQVAAHGPRPLAPEPGFESLEGYCEPWGVVFNEPFDSLGSALANGWTRNGNWILSNLSCSSACGGDNRGALYGGSLILCQTNTAPFSELFSPTLYVDNRDGSSARFAFCSALDGNPFNYVPLSVQRVVHPGGTFDIGQSPASRVDIEIPLPPMWDDFRITFEADGSSGGGSGSPGWKIDNFQLITEQSNAQDCNGNGISDWCDVTEGTSTDCDSSLVPDECENELVNGLTRTYHDGVDFDGLYPFGTIQESVINEVWSNDDVPVIDSGVDQFSVIWQGVLRTPNVSGTYTFRFALLGRAKFYLNNELLLDETGIIFGTTVFSTNIELQGDEIYSLRIEFVRPNSVIGSIRFEWSGPGFGFQFVPVANMHPGLDYQDNNRPDRCDIADNLINDCNDNGLDDLFEHEQQGAADCNDDQLLDECDISDRNQDGIFDVEQYCGATVLHVDAAVIGGDGTGLSWADALTDLSVALDIASAFPLIVEIQVAEGTYVSPSIAETFEVAKDSFKLVGGYITGGATRDPGMHPTILSADINGDDEANFVNRGDNDDNVLVVSGTSCVVDGFTLRGASGASGAGALLVTGESSVFKNLLITDNYSNTTDHSSAITFQAGTTGHLLVHCQIIANEASREPAIRTPGPGTQVSLYNCLIANNRSVDNGSIASVLEAEGLVEIVNCTFDNNSTTFGSGATLLADVGGTLFIRNTIMTRDVSRPFINFVGSTFNVGASLIEGGGPFSLDSSIQAEDLFIDADNGNWQLRFDAPAIDAGNTSALGPDLADIDEDGDTNEDLPIDLAGQQRVVDIQDFPNGPGTGFEGAVVDVGAYEFQSSVFLVDELFPNPLDPNDPNAYLNHPDDIVIPGCAVFYHDGDGDDLTDDRWFVAHKAWDANCATDGIIEITRSENGTRPPVTTRYTLIPVPHQVRPGNPLVSEVIAYRNSPWDAAGGRSDTDLIRTFRWNSDIKRDGNDNMIDDISVTGDIFTLETDAINDGEKIVIQYDIQSDGILVGFEVLTVVDATPSETYQPVGRRLPIPDAAMTDEPVELVVNSVVSGTPIAWQLPGTDKIWPIRPTTSSLFSQLRVAWYNESRIGNERLGAWPVAATAYNTAWPEEFSDGLTDVPDDPAVVGSQIHVIDDALDGSNLVDLRVSSTPSPNPLYNSVQVEYEEPFGGSNPNTDVSGQFLSIENPGYSVLRFCEDAACDLVSFEVVSSFDHEDALVFDAASPYSPTVGTSIEAPAFHDANTPNWPFGYVHQGLSIAPNIYFPGTLEYTGQIIPVNASDLNAGVDFGEIEVWFFEAARSSTIGNHAAGLSWPHHVKRYDPVWPSNPRELIIASRLGIGLEGLGIGDYGAASDVYFSGQRGDDPTDPSFFTSNGSANPLDPNYLGSNLGWNPNDEHATMEPIGGGSIAYARRDDDPWGLGVGHPWVLVQYIDVNKPSLWTFDVVKVARFDPNVPAYDDFDFSDEAFVDLDGIMFRPLFAGLKLEPVLYPVNIEVFEQSLTPCDGAQPFIELVDPNGLFVDKNNTLYLRSDQPGTVRIDEYWGRDNDPNCDPWLDGGSGNRNDSPLITYRPSWPPYLPQDCPVGTYCASDFFIGSTLPYKNPDGTPTIQSLEVLWDEIGVRVIDPELVVSAEFTDTSNVPDFEQLPPHLAFGRLVALGSFPEDRISISSGLVSFTGIMTQRDYEFLTSPDLFAGQNPPQSWLDAIGDPNVPDPDTLWTRSRAQIEDPNFVPPPGFVPHLSFSAPDAVEGYVTVVKNNQPADSDPIGVDVMHARCLAPPTIEVYSQACPFREKVTLQVLTDLDSSGAVTLLQDAGGNTDGIAYQWQFQQIGTNTWENFLDPNGEEIGLRERVLSGPATLSDILVRVRYRGFPGACPCDDDPNDPRTTDPNFCPPVGDGAEEWRNGASAGFGQVSPWSSPMIVQGWLKRLVQGLNPFDARIQSFHDIAGENFTYNTMIEQAGQPYTGLTEFSCDPGNLQSIGLIEAYSAARDRVKEFTLFSPNPVTSSQNLALMFITGNILDLHVLLGNEAFADASDPTTGVDAESSFKGQPVGVDGSSLWSFRGLVAGPLDEELALLRGNSTNVGTPLDNRLRWNFDTLFEGEAAYVNTYNLTDKTGEGNITLADGMISFPMGHGDAWGHMLTAMKQVYTLLSDPKFEWIVATELVPSGTGQTTPVSYLYERRFAQAAARKAEIGAQIVDLTFRDLYTGDPADDPDFPDIDPNRAWGLGDWARRAHQGAYFDWVLTTALLDDADPGQGIDQIDRTTVPELGEIVASAVKVQTTLDNAGSGLNPLGLSPNVVPFGINAAALAAGESHYEQVRGWAVRQLTNLKAVFDYANDNIRRLRQNEDDFNDFSVNVVAQELDWTNRLIEIFGRPFPEDPAYPFGYDGPDIFHFDYVNPSSLLVSLTGDEFEGADVDFASDAFTTSITYQIDDIVGLIDSDPTNTETYQVEFNVSTIGLGLIKPDNWSSRPEPGEIQLARSELLQAFGELQLKIELYGQKLDEIDSAIGSWENLTNKNATVLVLQESFQGQEKRLLNSLAAARTAQTTFNRLAGFTADAMEVIVQGIPTVIGLANDAMSPVRAAAYGAGLNLKNVFEVGADSSEIATFWIENDLTRAATQLDINITNATASFEESEAIAVIEALIRELPAMRVELQLQAEAIEQAVGRYQQAVGEGMRLLEQRTAFRKKLAATATDFRYKDFTFRLLRNESLEKYRALFDLTTRYVYMAAKAYDYETNLLGTDTESGREFLQKVIKERIVGVLPDGLDPDAPLPPATAGIVGLVELLGALDNQWQVIRQNQFVGNLDRTFSLRTQLFDLDPNAVDDDQWQDALRQFVVSDVTVLNEYRLFASPLQGLSGANAGLVIPFSTTVTEGLNFFGLPINGPDFPSDRYAVKLETFGVELLDLPGSLNPFVDVYLLPVGSDTMRTPELSPTIRSWNLIDQSLPIPQIVGTAFESPGWQPWDTFSGGPSQAVQRRLIPSIGACDPLVNTCDISTALVGRSVWNTRWVLVIPGSSLSNIDPPDVAIEQFIQGVSDIVLDLQAVGYNLNQSLAAETASDSEGE